MPELPGIKTTFNQNKVSSQVSPATRSTTSGVLSVPTATFTLPVQEGELLTATVLKLLPENKAIIELNGQTLVAETKMPLQEGQEMLLEAKGLLEGKVLLQLLAVGKNITSGSGLQAQFANILAQAGLPYNEDNVQILQALMKENAQLTIPIVKELARTLQSQGQFNPETIRAAVFLAVRDFPITGKNLQLAGLIIREGGGLSNYLGQVLRQLQAAAAAEAAPATQPTSQPTSQVTSPLTYATTTGTLPEENTLNPISRPAAGTNQASVAISQLHTKATITSTVHSNIPLTNESGSTVGVPGQRFIGIDLSTKQIGQVGQNPETGQLTEKVATNPVSRVLDQISTQTSVQTSTQITGHTTGQISGLVPDQVSGQTSGQVLAGSVKPEFKLFLVSILQGMLTIDLGETSQVDVKLAPPNLAAQVEIAGEAWQAKGLVGKILTALGANPQAPVSEQQVVKPAHQEVMEPKARMQPQTQLQIQAHVSKYPTLSGAFAQGTEQLREVLNARDLLQGSIQKSTEGFIGYFPLPTKLGEQFLGADMYVWKRKSGEKGGDSGPGSDKNGFHILFLLNTANLGNWRIDLVTRGENLSINIAVNEEVTGKLVKTRLSELKDKVERLGFKVNHLNCQISRPDQGATPEHQANDQAKSSDITDLTGLGRDSPLVTGLDLRI